MNAVEGKAYTDGFMMGVNAFSPGCHLDLMKLETLINECLSKTSSEENISVHEVNAEGDLVKTSTIKISSRDRAARTLSGFCASVEYVRRACSKKGISISLTKIESNQ